MESFDAVSASTRDPAFAPDPSLLKPPKCFFPALPGTAHQFVSQVGTGPDAQMNCGPSVMAMMARKFRPDLLFRPPLERNAVLVALLRSVRGRDTPGTPNEGMAEMALRLGLRWDDRPEPLSIEQLAAAVRKERRFAVPGNGFMLPWRSHPMNEFVGQDHWIAVVDVDAKQGQVSVFDPLDTEETLHTLSLAELELYRSKMGNTSFIVKSLTPEGALVVGSPLEGAAPEVTLAAEQAAMLLGRMLSKQLVSVNPPDQVVLADPAGQTQSLSLREINVAINGTPAEVGLDARGAPVVRDLLAPNAEPVTVTLDVLGQLLRARGVPFDVVSLDATGVVLRNPDGQVSPPLPLAELNKYLGWRTEHAYGIAAEISAPGR